MGFCLFWVGEDGGVCFFVVGVFFVVLFVWFSFLFDLTFLLHKYFFQHSKIAPGDQAFLGLEPSSVSLHKLACLFCSNCILIKRRQ